MKKIIAFLVFISLFSSAFAESYVVKTELEAANFLASEGIIADKSYAPSEYRLGDTITRKEVMKIIAKLGSDDLDADCVSSFNDVSSSDWGCKYIEWALDMGYIAANPNFRPDDNITKTEAMKLILKVQNIEKTQETDAWQEDYMMTAYEYGIIEAKYSDYNAEATRGWIFQIATVSIEKEEEIQIKIEEKQQKLMSSEV